MLQDIKRKSLREKTIFSIEIRDLFCPSFLNPAFSDYSRVTINLSYFALFQPFYSCVILNTLQSICSSINRAMRVVWEIRFSLRIRKKIEELFLSAIQTNIYIHFFLSVALSRMCFAVSLHWQSCSFTLYNNTRTLITLR